MKKLLIFLFVFSLSMINVQATNEVYVFKLDFANFETDAPTTDVSTVYDMTGNSSVVAVKGNGVSSGNFVNVNGETTKYLDLTDGGLQIVSEEIIKSLDDVTFECWAKLKLTNNAWKNFFSVADVPRSEAPAGKQEIRTYWYKNGKNYVLTYQGAPGENGMIDVNPQITNYEALWTHFVFTRKWDASLKQWEIAVYADGVKIADTTEKGVPTAATNNLLNIGWSETDNVFSFGQLGSFNVYDIAVNESRVAEMYNSTKNEYIELANTMNFVKISDKDITVHEENILLEYDNYVDESTVEKGVSLKKDDGSEIKGGVFFEIDGKKIILKFGKLEPESKYILTVTEELKSKNGIGAEAKEFEFFTAPYSDVVMSENFSGDSYVTGAIPPDNGMFDYVSKDGVKVFEDNGDKYLKLQGKSAIEVYKMFEEPFEYGKLVVDMKIKAASDDLSRGNGNMPRESGRIIWNEAKNSYAAVMTLSAGFPQVMTSYIGDAPFTAGSPTDENGFYAIRYNITRTPDDAAFTVVISNALVPDSPKATLKLTSGTKIYGIMGAHTYAWGSDAEEQIKSDYSAISEIKITRSENPTILNVSGDGMNPQEREITVTFSNDMNGETIKNVVVSDLIENRKVPTEILSYYNEDTRSIKIRTKEYLSANTEYMIQCTGAEDVVGNCMISSENAKFKTANYSVYATNIGLGIKNDQVTVTADIKNYSGEEKNIMVACAFYDSEGRMEKFETTSSMVKGSKSFIIKSKMQPNVGFSRVYVLDMTQGYMKYVAMKKFEFEQKLEQPAITEFYNNKPAAVTITFDDGDYSSAQYYDNLMSRYNIHGTAMLVANWVKNEEIEGWRNILSNGNIDIGNHSLNHDIQYDSSEVAEEDVRNDISGGYEKLKEIFPDEKILTFASPWTRITDVSQNEVKKHHYANRLGGMGYISPNPDEDTLMKLPAYIVENSHSLSMLTDEIDTVLHKGNWLIYMLHGVGQEQYFINKDVCSKFFEYIGNKNAEVWAGSLNEVVQYIYEKQNSTIVSEKKDSNTLNVTLTDTLDNNVFDFPLTVKVDVPDLWQTIDVSQNGRELTYETFEYSGNKYILVNIVPDTGTVIIRNK